MSDSKIFQGEGAVAGLGIGKIFIALTSDKNIPIRHIEPSESEHSLSLLVEAHQAALEKLTFIRDSAAEIISESDAAIYSTQISVLEDPEAINSLQRYIREDLLAPESALQKYITEIRNRLADLDIANGRETSADWVDPWRMVLREMSAEDLEKAQAESVNDLVLVADELTPTLVVRYPRNKISAIVASRGGKYSHAAILAKSFGIPTVVGIKDFDLIVRSGWDCIVNGDTGEVELSPSPEHLTSASQLFEDRKLLKGRLVKEASEPVLTIDGKTISILANLESPLELDFFDSQTVDGVGLFRTEFIYMNHDGFPTVEEQEEAYKKVINHFAPRRIVFRTLDVGNDKQLDYLNLHSENNPALGMRGVRLSLMWQDMFYFQLQALSNASQIAPIDIMLPMVTSIEEVREARQIFREVVENSSARLRFGVMIEVPSAVMSLPEIAEEVDFVSVGTNDLAQYLFAVDRDNPWVSGLYQPYHPANLRVLRAIAKICHKAGVEVSVCGEMAAQPEGALFLVGCGFDSLSLSPALVPEIKAYIRELDSRPLSQLAMRASNFSTSHDAFNLLSQEATRTWAKLVAHEK
jgi:phosphotransferase system enzyme I (PtsI)